MLTNIGILYLQLYTTVLSLNIKFELGYMQTILPSFEHETQNPVKILPSF